MIFFKKDPVLGVDLESAINNAVFPGLQVSCTCFMIRNLIYTRSFICFYKFSIYISNFDIKKDKCLSSLCRVVLITTLLGALQFA